MLICPICKFEYEDGNLICSDCGTELVEQFEGVNKNSKLNWFENFGNITVQRAITTLFYLGIVPLFISAILTGKYIYLTQEYSKDITFMQDGAQLTTQYQANNLPLGILFGSIYFVFGILIWKIICELLIIIFRCFETYVQKNKR